MLIIFIVSSCRKVNIKVNSPKKTLVKKTTTKVPAKLTVVKKKKIGSRKRRV